MVSFMSLKRIIKKLGRDKVSEYLDDIIDKFSSEDKYLLGSENAETLLDKKYVDNGVVIVTEGKYKNIIGYIAGSEQKKRKLGPSGFYLVFFIDVDYRKKGIMFESLQSYIQIIFNQYNYKYIFTSINKLNTGSIKLVEKLNAEVLCENKQYIVYVIRKLEDIDSDKFSSVLTI